MSSELYSRTFSDPGCTMSPVEEGASLLPPCVHKYAKRLGGGQAFQGEIQGSPFQDVEVKSLGSAFRDTWVQILASSLTCCVMLGK